MDIKYSLACLLALLWISPSSPFHLDDVDDIFSMTTKVLELVKKGWQLADQVEERVGNEKTPLMWYTKKKERTLLANFEHITQLVHNTQKETDDIRSMMLRSLKKLETMPNVLLSGIQVNELLESVRSIESDFNTMEEYKTGRNDIDNDTDISVNATYTSYTLEKFADAMLSFTSSAPIKEMAKIHSYIYPEWDGFKFHTHGGIFNILRETMESSDLLCDQKQSLQQLIFNLYSTMHYTQLKGYTIIQFSWMLLETYNKGNFSFERKTQKKNFEKKIAQQLEVLKSSMASANNLYWKCDPEKHVADETYVEVTQLLQGYIENEADMNYEQSCLQNCAYYEVADHKSCFGDQFCAKQHTCKGRILNCHYYDSDMKICQSKFGSNRRYDYITFENGKVLGDSSKECKSSMSKVDSWWVYLLWHCSYCFCICDSNESTSDRYFSLKPSISNINENKVVTGVKFTKVKQMFHLQIQEGKLGPRGSIDEHTRKWVNVPGSEFSYKNHSLKNDVDYHTLTYTARAIDLDNLIAPNYTVITGVKFRMIGSHLNIEVRVTPYDFLTGKLDVNKSYWFGNDNTEVSGTPRSEIDIKDSDLPTKSTSPTESDMSSNKFLKFTHSSIDHDVAQTTLPYIDIQPVVPYPGVPLSGLGLYFKGTKSYAGFIGPNIFTYNFTDFLNTELFNIRTV